MFFNSFPGNGQIDTSINYNTRKIILVSGTTAFAGASLIYLNQAWYQQYSNGNFHEFDDNAEWLQMDKFGHAYTTFQTSRLMMNAFKWAGFNKKQQIYIGGTLGLGYMTVIELMDGFSSGWGFSWGDMLSNVLGTAASLSQYALWNEHRFNLKYSYSPTGFAQYNPKLLGGSYSEQFLKDYNGQTYWLSVSPFTFIKSDKYLPKWLAITFGYGGDGMLGARDNNSVIVTDENGNTKAFNRSRQYYISLDIDFSQIKTKSKILKGIFNTLNLLKIPSPTIEFKNGATYVHYLYF